MDYIVFDVETPNRANDRISAIGITVVRDRSVIDEYYSLVNPEAPFDYFNIRLTGIDGKAVENAPTFPELWSEISPVMDSGILVAHNAAFDMRVLKSCLRNYGIQWKQSVPYLCTVQAGRRLLPGTSHKLNDLCEHFGIALDHHNAASDSRACAEILLRYIQTGADIHAFIKSCDLSL